MAKLIYSAFIYFRCVRYGGGIDRSKSLGLRGGGVGTARGAGAIYLEVWRCGIL